MDITRHAFGVTRKGEPVSLWRLHGPGGTCAEVLDYGAALHRLLVRNRTGELVDVCLGYDSLGEYEVGDGKMGAIVGRFANRIGGASFLLDGEEYPLAKNDGENHLHGGIHGFDQQVWQALPGSESITFARTSPHGEEGYPGNLDVQVTYRWDGQELRLEYGARTDRPTVLNLTSHVYFNLAGRGDVLDHSLQIWAHAYTENDGQTIPTGRILPVGGTPLDFQQERFIGEGLAQSHPLLEQAKGYDANLVLSSQGEGVRPCAKLTAPHGELEMTVLTDQPGVQLYTANYLTERWGKGGAAYGPRSGICLETQHYPDTMAHPNFPPCVLRPGEAFSSTTVFSFRA